MRSTSHMEVDYINATFVALELYRFAELGSVFHTAAHICQTHQFSLCSLLIVATELAFVLGVLYCFFFFVSHQHRIITVTTQWANKGKVRQTWLFTTQKKALHTSLAQCSMIHSNAFTWNAC